MLERPLEGTAEMLSITNDIVAIYTYRLPNTPSLWICNWRQKMETQITNEVSLIGSSGGCHIDWFRLANMPSIHRSTLLQNAFS